MTTLKTLVSAAFFQRRNVTRFLRSYFRSPPEFKFQGAKVRIDTVRGKDEYSINVTRGTGPRRNKFNIFTKKTYDPPAYDESGYVEAEELNEVMPGRSVNDMTPYVMDLADLIVDRQLQLRDKIERAIEIQCRDGLVNGKITLINGDDIDFNQKTALQYSTPVAWTNSTANPLNDFEVIGDRILGYSNAMLVDAIFGSTALQKFINNDIVKSKGDLKQIDRMAITSPLKSDDAAKNGAKYHGTFSAGSFLVNVWTYPQKVGIPVGFGLPNENTKQPYVPADKIICISEEPDFRLYYAGVPTLKAASVAITEMTGMGMMPAMESADMMPYFRLDEKNKSLEIGVESRPVAIPVEVDGYGVITVT